MNPELPPADCAEYLERLEWRFCGRDPKEDELIFCPKCSTQMRVAHIGGCYDSDKQDALNVAHRTRRCPKCSAETHTTELSTAELHELRRMAYSARVERLMTDRERSGRALDLAWLRDASPAAVDSLARGHNG